MPIRYSRLSSGGGTANGSLRDAKGNKFTSTSSDLPDKQPCGSAPLSSKNNMRQQYQQQLQQEAWEEAMPASYQLWRSRQLLALDVHFCVLYIFTHIVYGVKTAKHLCPQVMKAGGGSIISRWAAAVLCTNNVASSVVTHATAALTRAPWLLPVRLLLRPVAVLLQVLFTGVQVGQPVHPGTGEHCPGCICFDEWSATAESQPQP